MTFQYFPSSEKCLLRSPINVLLESVHFMNAQILVIVISILFAHNIIRLDSADYYRQ